MGAGRKVDHCVPLGDLIRIDFLDLYFWHVWIGLWSDGLYLSRFLKRENEKNYDC